MEFNVEKCCVMQFGNNNNNYTYKMNGDEIQVTEEEKDLGIAVQKSLKPTKYLLGTMKRKLI